MAGKRKRSIKESTSAQRKAAKTAEQAQAHPHGEFDPEQEYEINAIVDESKREYLIQWKDNPVTGEKYDDSWEPKRLANRLAVQDWEQTKRQRSEAARVSGENTTTPPRKRGRPRKSVTVLSSPPPPEPSPETNGEVSQPVSNQEDDLEIGESQPTVTGAEGDSEAGSPLFVPIDSPKPRASRKQPQPSVQLSDPPSSYAAGVYQDFSSSQIPESAAPRRRLSRSPELQPSQAVEGANAQPESQIEPASSAKSAALAQVTRQKSPEPSQWHPEEGDTSKTAEDTTEVSLAPTSSEPTRSAPAIPGQPVNLVVPDSQSQPDSSSFVPTQTETQSSSAPEPRARGRPPKEVTQNPNLLRSQSESQSSWQGIPSQPAERQHVSQAQPSLQLDPVVHGDSQAVGEAESEAGARISGVLESPSQNNPVQAVNQEAATASEHSASRSNIQPSALSQRVPSIAADDPPALAATPAANIEQQAHSQPAHPSKRQPAAASAVEIRQSAPAATNSEAVEEDVRETTERPDLSHVDLTADTQPPAGEASSITVTPLPARHIAATERNANSILLAQSLQSSLAPFQTQFSRHFSSTTGGRSAPSEYLSRYPQVVQSQPDSRPSLGPPFQPSGEGSAPTFSSQPPPSSLIPSGPKRSLGTLDFGESAPPRPQTPSSDVHLSSPSSTMESPNSNLSGIEKLRAMRARKNAELQDRIAERRAARAASRTSTASTSAVETSPKSSIPPHVAAEATAAPLNPARLASPGLMVQDGARSPSVVPAMEDLPEITTEEMNTSERYPTLLPQASAAEGEAAPQRNGSLTGRVTPSQPQVAATTDPETASVHVVSITLVGHQRDQYPQTIYYHQGLIQKFLEAKSTENRVIENAKNFVDRMRAIALHPDLDNPETATQYDVEPEQQASWDVSCSAKFRFLKTLLMHMQAEEKHIVIALQNSRLIDILRTFLKGICIAATMAGASAESSSSEASKLLVTIVTGGQDTADLAKADLVICLDGSFSHSDPAIRALRQRDGSWCPFASLVVPKSVEHVDMQLSSTLSDRARLRALVRGIHELKAEAGRQDGEQLNPTDSAKAIAEYLMDSAADKTWPLAGLNTLPDLDSQTESEIEPTESVVTPALGTKRQRTGSAELADSDDLNKRVRVEEAANNVPVTVSLQDVELTHISESLDKLTQAQDLGDNADDTVLHTDTGRRLQALLQQALDRKEELESALSDLQYRFEDARTHLIRTTSERDHYNAAATEAALRITELKNRDSILRTERTELKTKLEEANLMLVNHTVPERAEAESLRQTLAQANAEKAMVEKRLEQSKSNSDFFRDQYQEASNTAQGEVAANAELRNQVAALTNRATGEQAKLRQTGYDARTKALEKENRKLKAVLKDREAGLKFRDEEIAKLKEASRGRMGTRGTSVPRSPRLASPMGLATGPRSRQGSPAAGELKGRAGGSLLHPLRNNASG